MNLTVPNIVDQMSWCNTRVKRLRWMRKIFESHNRRRDLAHFKTKILESYRKIMNIQAEKGIDLIQIEEICKYIYGETNNLVPRPCPQEYPNCMSLYDWFCILSAETVLYAEVQREYVHQYNLEEDNAFQRMILWKNMNTQERYYDWPTVRILKDRQLWSYTNLSYRENKSKMKRIIDQIEWIRTKNQQREALKCIGKDISSWGKIKNRLLNSYLKIIKNKVSTANRDDLLELEEICFYLFQQVSDDQMDCDVSDYEGEKTSMFKLLKQINSTKVVFDIAKHVYVTSDKFPSHHNLDEYMNLFKKGKNKTFERFPHAYVLHHSFSTKQNILINIVNI